MQNLLAVVASATVAGWTAWKDFPALWQTLSIIGAVVSVALPIIDVPRHIETMGEVHEGWSTVLADYEEIWNARAGLPDADAAAAIKKFRGAETKLMKKTAKLPNDDKKLGAKVFDDIVRERGLA